MLRAKARLAKSTSRVFLMTRAAAAMSMSAEHEVLERIHERLQPQK